MKLKSLCLLQNGVCAYVRGCKNTHVSGGYLGGGRWWLPRYVHISVYICPEDCLKFTSAWDWNLTYSETSFSLEHIAVIFRVWNSEWCQLPANVSNFFLQHNTSVSISLLQQSWWNLFNHCTSFMLLYYIHTVHLYIPFFPMSFRWCFSWPC